MQLMLAIDDRCRLLVEIHHRLRRCFGPQGPFVLLDPVSQLVMAIIGGRTHGADTKVAFEALLRRFVRWEAVRDASADEICRTIGTVTYAERKAPLLKQALATLTASYGRLTLDPLASLTPSKSLAWLERLPGVGRKVAAATLNFSTLRKPVLVIDTHHLRILRRLALVDPRAGLTRAHDCITPLLPTDWSAADFDEHHQLMKTLGQSTCTLTQPVCHRCPLQNLCPARQTHHALPTHSKPQSYPL